jgi:hypothetical protein
MRASEMAPIHVRVREHKINTREGIGHMVKLGVKSIPTICIDGAVAFESVIPDVETLARAMADRAKAKV